MRDVRGEGSAQRASAMGTSPQSMAAERIIAMPRGRCCPQLRQCPRRAGGFRGQHLHLLDQRAADLIPHDGVETFSMGAEFFELAVGKPLMDLRALHEQTYFDGRIVKRSAAITHDGSNDRYSSPLALRVVPDLFDESSWRSTPN